MNRQAISSALGLRQGAYWIPMVSMGAGGQIAHKRRYLSGAVAAAGLLLGAASLVPIIEAGQGSVWIIALLAISVATLAAGLAFAFSDSAYDLASSLLFGRTRSAIRRATCRHAGQVHRFAQKHFGDGVTSETQISAIIKKYRKSLTICINDSHRDAERLLGYYFVFPITHACIDDITSYKFDATTLSMDKVCSSTRAAAAIYIGGIAAEGFRAKSELLGALKSQWTVAKETQLKLVFARAATENGRRLLLQNEFRPVHPKADSVGCFYSKQF